MTFDEFINKYDGKKIDYDGFHDGQCVDLYRQYVKEVLEFPQSQPVEGAKDVWDTYLKDKYTRVANTPDGIPDKGDIVIWNSGAGTYGHIAIFIEGTTGSFKSFDQNWPVGSPCHIQGHYYSNVLGWLKPIKQEDNMTDEQKRILDFIGNRSEGDVREAFGALVDIQNLKEKVVALEKLSDDLKNRVGELEDKLSENEVSIADYQKQVITANKLIAKQKEEIEALTKERADYKKWYETALNKAADKLTSWELLQLLIKKLQWWKK